MASGPVLAGERLDRVFPFHFELDDALRLTSVGSSLARLCPALRSGEAWESHFVVRRPSVDADALRATPLAELARLSSSPFLLAHRDSELALRGQFLVEEERSRALFLGLPWVTSVRQLEDCGVRLSDFPLHTPLADLVFVIQNQQASLEEARQLAKRLRRNQQVLARAKEEAEAAAIAKDAFLANISHEIRTPLNGITGMTRLLLASTLRPDQAEYAELIERSSSALLAVLQDVIQLAQIRAGRLELELVPFSPDALLEGVVGMYTGAARAKGIAVELLRRRSLPTTLVGDVSRLRQVLYNLLGNAVKFTDDGSVTLEARMEALDEDGEANFVLRVTDTGVGIPCDSLQRIFEEFVQVDDSATRRHGGSGLGLSICRRLVHLLGGEIHAESSEGQGATFTVSVPVRVVAPAATAAGPSVDDVVGPVELLNAGAGALGALPTSLAAEARPRAIPFAPPGARLLVVEDNAVNQLVAQRLLRKLGYVVDCASNGAEAVERVRAQPYDLVLMDLQMPVMDGFEATRRIRALAPPSSEVPIVALTANALPEHRDRCLAEGMDDFVSKPFDFEVLAGTIAGRLGSRSAQRSG